MNAEIGIAKLELKRGDVLLVTVPDEWSPDMILAFHSWFTDVYDSIMHGAKVMILSDRMSATIVRDGTVAVSVGMHH